MTFCCCRLTVVELQPLGLGDGPVTWQGTHSGAESMPYTNNPRCIGSCSPKQLPRAPTCDPYFHRMHSALGGEYLMQTRLT